MNIIRLLALLSCLLPLPAAAEAVLLDSIVAIVDEDVITERDLNDKVELIRAEFQRSNRSLPEEDVLHRQVLDTLVNESLLLQEADRRGITVTDSQLNQSMQQMARRNNMSLSDFRSALLREGMDYDRYRETIRRERIIATLGRQYSQRHASVSQTELDEFIELTQADSTNYEYRLSHILISLPDAATPQEIEDAQARAQEILDQLSQGTSFAQLANTYSTGETALRGGDLGWRKKAEIPSLFTSAVLTMEPGDYEGPIRSASGFHIVHLNEWRDLEITITRQTRSRHILVKTNELISEDEARRRLVELRERLEAGEDFERLARLYSVDYTTGAAGGDLGWRDPGSLVPEYEEAAAQLEIDEISQPVRSQFGWHLIQVTGRREVDDTEEHKRNKIYSQLLQQKQYEVFDLWKRRLRDEAYVAYPTLPDA